MNLNRRITFDKKLRQILQDNGLDVNIYFEPPRSISVKTPNILYKLDRSKPIYGDNKAYVDIAEYTVIFRTKEPCCIIHNDLLKLGQSSFVSKYTKDGLNHYQYKIYY